MYIFPFSLTKSACMEMSISNGFLWVLSKVQCKITINFKKLPQMIDFQSLFRGLCSMRIHLDGIIRRLYNNNMDNFQFHLPHRSRSDVYQIRSRLWKTTKRFHFIKFKPFFYQHSTMMNTSDVLICTSSLIKIDRFLNSTAFFVYFLWTEKLIAKENRKKPTK